MLAEEQNHKISAYLGTFIDAHASRDGLLREFFEATALREELFDRKDISVTGKAYGRSGLWQLLLTPFILALLAWTWLRPFRLFEIRTEGGMRLIAARNNGIKQLCSFF